MSVTAAREAISHSIAAELRRLDEERRLRRLLARSDDLLDKAERANARGNLLHPRFAVELCGLVADMAPALLAPKPVTLTSLHVRLGLALRGWSQADLARGAKVRHDYVARAVQSPTIPPDTAGRICEAFAKHPPGSPAATPREPIGAQAIVDLVFDLQEILFGLIAQEAAEPPVEEERLTADLLATFRRACCWLEVQPGGRARTSEMPGWLEQLIDRLGDHLLVRAFGVHDWGPTVAWRAILDGLEQQLKEGEVQPS